MRSTSYLLCNGFQLVASSATIRVPLATLEAIQLMRYVQRVPTGGLSGHDPRAFGHVGSDPTHRLRLGLEHMGDNLAFPLAGDDHDFAFAGLVRGQPPIPPANAKS